MPPWLLEILAQTYPKSDLRYDWDKIPQLLCSWHQHVFSPVKRQGDKRLNRLCQSLIFLSITTMWGTPWLDRAWEAAAVGYFERDLG